MKLLRYIARRLALMSLSIFGVLVITFVLSHVIPADPVGAILGPQAPPELVDKVRAELGFDKSIPEQFVIYVRNIVTGDLGKSLRTQNPVTEDLLQFFPATLELATTALLIGVFMGIPLGVISAVKKDQIPDHVARLFSLIGLSMPVFWLGLILLLVLWARLDLLPGPGQLDPRMIRPPQVTGFITLDSIIAGNWEAFRSAVMHLIMPAFVLGYFSTAAITRITRSSMLDVLGQEYIEAARVKGVKERVVIYRHALRNAMIPTVTIIGVTYGGLLEGSVLTESIFSWPGLGRYATSSFLFLDFPAVMGATLLIALTFSLANLVVDIVYAFLNPRIGVEGI